MACKPPRTSIAKARPSFLASANHPSNFCRLKHLRACAKTRPRAYCLVEPPLSVSTVDNTRRQGNAVGQVGVKLGAAPDAPPWGQVLVRTPVDRFPFARWRAISTSICPLREFPVCPALAKDLGGIKPRGPQPRQGWPASCGGSRLRWPTVMRRRAPGRRRGRDPYPGKDPL